MDWFKPEFLLGALSPFLTAAVAAGGAWLRERRQSRNRYVAWRRAVEDATAQVSYTSAWLTAVKEAEPTEAYMASQERARAELDRIDTDLAAQRTAIAREAAGAEEPLGRRVRRLVVPPRPPGALAALLRAGYVVAVGWLLLCLAVGLAVAADSLSGGLDDPGDTTADRVGTAAFALVLLSAVGLVPVGALRLGLTALARGQQHAVHGPWPTAAGASAATFPSQRTSEPHQPAGVGRR